MINYQAQCLHLCVQLIIFCSSEYLLQRLVRSLTINLQHHPHYTFRQILAQECLGISTLKYCELKTHKMRILLPSLSYLVSSCHEVVISLAPGMAPLVHDHARFIIQNTAAS